MAKARSAFRDLKNLSRGEEGQKGGPEERENAGTEEHDTGTRAGKPRNGCKKVGLVLPEEMHRKLSVKAAEKGLRLSGLVERVLAEYLDLDR